MTRKHHSPEYKTRITADIGAEVPADCVALISTTLGADAMVQARFSNVASFSVTLADTGLLSAEAQDESQGNVVLVFSAPVTAQYLRVDLTDGAVPYLDSACLSRGSFGGCSAAPPMAFARVA